MRRAPSALAATPETSTSIGFPASSAACRARQFRGSTGTTRCAARNHAHRPRDQPAAAHGDQHCIGVETLILPLRHAGALPGHGRGGVIGVDLHRAGGRLVCAGGFERIGIGAGHHRQIGAQPLDQGDLGGPASSGTKIARGMPEPGPGMRHCGAVVAARGRDEPRRRNRSRDSSVLNAPRGLETAGMLRCSSFSDRTIEPDFPALQGPACAGDAVRSAPARPRSRQSSPCRAPPLVSGRSYTP